MKPIDTSEFADGVLDPDWYASRYPDVALSGLAPADHYALIGRRLGRAAGSADDRAADPEVAAAVAQLTAMFGEAGVPAELRERIAATGMFDEAWYRQHYRVVIVEDALADYLAISARDVSRDPGPLFSTAYYLEANPDVTTTHPLVHYACGGLAEARCAIPAAKANAYFEGAPLHLLMPLKAMLDATRPVAVLYWEDGNFFFADIARYTAEFLATLGYRSQVRTDDASIDPATTLLVVAPHEYCVYGPGRFWDEATAAAAVYLNTEQWHTTWFALAWSALRRSGRVLDINPAAAAAFAALGLQAGFIPLLPLAGTCFDYPRCQLSPAVSQARAIAPLTYPAVFAERPYDVLFVGALNERRSKALASLAPTLAQADAFLHCPTFGKPVKAGDADMLSSSDFTQLARNSRILLNIHQGESHYFEWHRIVLTGIMEGCVVLTEPSNTVGLVTAGVHYIEATLEQMPAVLTGLLQEPQGQVRLEEVHANCAALRARVDAGEKLMLP